MAFDFPLNPTLGQKYPEPPIAGQPVYTWDNEKWVSSTEGSSEILYVNVSGDTMTGPLVLAGAPTVDLQAATKKYVDDALAPLLATAAATAFQMDVNGDAIIKFGASIVVRIKPAGLILTKDDIEVFSVSV